MKLKRKNNTAGIYIFFVVMSLVLFLVTSSVIPFLGNAKGLPGADLLLCLVCAMSALTDRKKACIFAVVLGFAADLFLFEPTAFSPVIYLISALTVPMFCGYFSYTSSVVMAVCSLPSCILRSVAESVVTVAVFGNADISAVINKITLPMFIVNFASAIVICFICRLLVRKLRLSSAL